MQIKKSLRFLLISLCIMSGHNAGLCATSNNDITSICGPDYTDKTKKAAIRKDASNSYSCIKPCENQNHIFFGRLKGEEDSGPVKYCADTDYGFFELKQNAKCDNDRYGILFDGTNNSEEVFADLAHCVLCSNYTDMNKQYVLAYGDEKHDNTVFDAYQLNECVDCSYANFKGYYVINEQTCEKCPDGYGFDESHGISPNTEGKGILERCGKCIADGYGKVVDQCGLCNETEVSFAQYDTNGTRVYNRCISRSSCNSRDGYGISANDKACKKCADDEESVVDSSGVRRCVSNACTGGVMRQYDSPYSIANVQSGPDNYKKIYKAIHECKSNGNKKYELIDCTDSQKAIYFKKVDNVIYKFCVNKSEVEGTGFTTYGAMYASNDSTISYYRVFCNTQADSNKGVYWNTNKLYCSSDVPSSPDFNYLLTYSGSSEELYQTYGINEWVKDCWIPGYGVDGNQCKKCDEGYGSVGEEGVDDYYTCFQCSNSDIIEGGFCKRCDGNTTPNSARTQCEACSGNSVANSANTACLQCPNNSSAQDGTCKCTGSLSKKMPGAYFVANPLDFTCKEECDNEYASVYYDENSKKRVEYDVCKQCKRTADHKYYHANYWKNGSSPEARSFSICRAECDTANGYGKQSADSFTCIKCSEYKADGTKITESNYTGDTLVLKNGVCSTGCDQYQVKHNGECKYCYEIDDSQKIYDRGANDLSETDEARCILSSNCKFEQGNNKPKFIEKYYKSKTRTVLVGKPDNETVENQNFPDAEGKKMYICGSCAENQDIDKNTANVSVICHACATKSQWYDVNGGVGERCKNCPNNFMCNGVDKKACPFGFVSDSGGNFTCKANGSATNGTGLVKKTSNTAFDIVEYSSFLTEEEIYYNDYVKNNNTDSIEQYAYDSCNTENAAYIKVENYSVKNITEYESWASSGHISFADISVYACKSCATGEKASGDKCVCGKGEEFKTYGLMGSKCIVCPNGREGNNDQESQSWRCKTCPEGFGYNETKESCDKCLKDNPSYAGKCMSFQELQESEGNGAHAFYPTLVSDNAYKWGSCPNVINSKGVCCYGGKSYVCALGTISKAGGICGNGDKISNPVRDLGSCPIKCTITGKTTTTKSTGTYYKNNASVISEQAIADQLCTEYREPIRFCPWGLGNIVNGKYEGAYDSSNPQHSQCFKFTPEILEAVYGFPKVDYTKDVPANLPDNGTDE